MASVTVGYSDSEDRVWVRLVDAHVELRVWLTRRTVAGLIERLGKFLESSLVELAPLITMESANRLSMEHDEAASLMSEVSPAPKKPEEGYAVIDGGLCALTEVDIRDSHSFVRLYPSGYAPVVFNVSRLQAHQLLKSLINRQREAGWQVSVPIWIDA